MSRSEPSHHATRTNRDDSDQVASFVPQSRIQIVIYDSEDKTNMTVLTDLLDSVPVNFDKTELRMKWTLATISRVVYASPLRGHVEINRQVRQVMARTAERAHEWLKSQRSGFVDGPLDKVFDRSLLVTAHRANIQLPLLGVALCPLSDLVRSRYGVEYINVGFDIVSQVYRVASEYASSAGTHTQDGLRIGLVAATEAGAFYAPSRIRRTLLEHDSELRDFARAVRRARTRHDTTTPTNGLMEGAIRISSVLDDIEREYRSECGSEEAWDRVETLHNNYNTAINGSITLQSRQRLDSMDRAVDILYTLVGRMSELGLPLTGPYQASERWR